MIVQAPRDIEVERTGVAPAHVDQPGWRHPSLQQRPGTPRRDGAMPHVILFLAANPRGSDPLRLGEECSEIQRELKLTHHRDDFQFESRWAVSVDDLIRHLTELDPSVIHFSGHSGHRTGLLLQDERGEPQPVSPRTLAMIVSAAARNARIVVLNACHSAPYAAALCGTVDCVVGMNGAIGDDAARAFAVRFYGALGSRRSIGNAVTLGVAALAARQLPDEVLPGWTTREGIDAHDLVLHAVGPPAGNDPSEACRPELAATPPLQSPGPGTYTFIGRDREASEIEALITGFNEIQRPVALDGLPGIGKTELARQVVARLSRNQQCPGGIYWFSAEAPDLRQQWAKIAADLGGPALRSLDHRAAWAIQQIEQRARRGETTLVVLDHVDSWAPPPGPLPDITSVRLLVTTHVRWLHNSFRFYEVQRLSLAHSRQLLHAVVGRDVPHADDLLHALGGHVLSIELAATYLREYGTQPADYLKQLLTGKSPSSTVIDQTSYRATAESAFKLLWRQLTAELRTAWLLAAQLPSTWFTCELADAIGLDPGSRRGLVKLHLLERDDQGRHQMPGLLREFALAEVPDNAVMREAVVDRATEILETGDPAFLFQRYSRDADSFDHLRTGLPDTARWVPLKAACAAALEQLGDLPAARDLYDKVLATDLAIHGDDHEIVAARRVRIAKVLEALGDLPAARIQCEQALASTLRAHHPDDPAIAAARANLAGVLHESGDLSTARVLYEQALATHLVTYGSDHPAVATIQAELSALLQQLGQLPAARRLLEQALASAVATHGGDHPTVALRRASLAGVLRQVGELSAARRLYEQALTSDLATYGDGHPTVATRRSNLAALLHQLGEMSAARALHEQALAANLATYGNAHPAVAAARANLAGLLRDLGEPTIARALYEQALASDVRTYGDDHPTIATTRANLAGVLRQLGDLPAARTLYEQTLAAALRIYSDDHPAVAIRRANLGSVLRELGDAAAARVLCEQALTAARNTFGDDHPTTATRRANLAAVLQDLGDLAGARALYEQALASSCRIYGDDHPTVATTSANLARLLRRLGDLPAAKTLYARALATARKTYGDHHPTVTKRRTDLAALLREIGEPAAARELYEEAIASACLSQGTDHPNIITTRAELASLLQHLGDMASARAAYERALVEARRYYGDDHPTVSTTRAKLDALLEQLDEAPA